LKLVLATVLRIIIPFSVGSDALNECPKCCASVVAYYSSVSRTLFILTTLFLLGISLADLTADWISVAYVLLMMYMVRWTAIALLKQLNNVHDTNDAFWKEFPQHWWSYFNTNDTYWPNLEKKLQCCGLDGPRSYMEYLQKVPRHCYTPDLITLGCGQIMHDLFDPMPRVGFYMYVITLSMELFLMNFYGYILCKKLFSLVPKKRSKKGVSKPSL
ncbi:hypothetical protein KR054_012211, partial [Drosophila jambulina]